MELKIENERIAKLLVEMNASNSILKKKNKNKKAKKPFLEIPCILLKDFLTFHVSEKMRTGHEDRRIISNYIRCVIKKLLPEETEAKPINNKILLE
jgi:hypothetical protein